MITCSKSFQKIKESVVSSKYQSAEFEEILTNMIRLVSRLICKGLLIHSNVSHIQLRTSRKGNLNNVIINPRVAEHFWHICLLGRAPPIVINFIY